MPDYPQGQQPSGFENFVRSAIRYNPATSMVPPVLADQAAAGVRGFPGTPGQLASSWGQLGTNLARALGLEPSLPSSAQR